MLQNQSASSLEDGEFKVDVVDLHRIVDELRHILPVEHD